MESVLLVDRSVKTLRERALDKVRDAIVSRRFAPGERLVERSLCEQLGVSRSVVREVLRYLEAEGLVTTVGQRGPVVARLTIEETAQVYEIRRALESLAVRACARAGRAASIAKRLDSLLSDVRAAYTRKSHADVIATAGAFYEALFEEADKKVAWTIISSLHHRINHLRALTIKTPRRPIEGPAQLQKIVDAIRSGDEDAACQACFDHIDRAATLALQILRDEERSAAS